MKFLKWNEDEWLSLQGNVLPFDKAEHFLLAAIATTLGIEFIAPLLASWMTTATPFMSFFLTTRGVMTFVFLLGLGWEIRDGFKRPAASAIVQGFSWKDLIANAVGILAGLTITAAV